MAGMTMTLENDRLSETFAALANPTRRAILARLAEGPANVNELVEPFTLSAPAISKHLKVLEHAGLITRDRRAQFRPCTLDPAPLAAVSAWTEQYRSMWEARFDHLAEYVGRLQHDDRRGDIQ
jgi:DNA-binding transcriptional ArsR family regulator